MSVTLFVCVHLSAVFLPTLSCRLYRRGYLPITKYKCMMSLWLGHKLALDLQLLYKRVQNKFKISWNLDLLTNSNYMYFLLPIFFPFDFFFSTLFLVFDFWLVLFSSLFRFVRMTTIINFCEFYHASIYPLLTRTLYNFGALLLRHISFHWPLCTPARPLIRIVLFTLNYVI